MGGQWDEANRFALSPSHGQCELKLAVRYACSLPPYGQGEMAGVAGEHVFQEARAGRSLAALGVGEGGGDEAGEERVGEIGFGLELGMELRADEKRMIWQLDDFHESFIG